MEVEAEFVEYFSENGVELVIDSQEYGLVYNRNTPTSLKMGNIFIDIRKNFDAAVQIFSGIQRPESLFNAIQLILLVALSLKDVVNVRLPKGTSEILIVLMKNDGDRIALDEAMLYDKVMKYCKRYEIKMMGKAEFFRINSFLEKYGIIEITGGKILLKERVFGKDFV